jgi:hypothetical protein
MFLVQKLPWDSPRNILQGKHGFPKFNFFFNFQFDHACSTSNNSSGRTRTAPDIQTGKDDKHGRQMSHFVGQDCRIDGTWHRLVSELVEVCEIWEMYCN